MSHRPKQRPLTLIKIGRSAFAELRNSPSRVNSKWSRELIWCPCKLGCYNATAHSKRPPCPLDSVNIRHSRGEFSSSSEPPRRMRRRPRRASSTLLKLDMTVQLPRKPHDLVARPPASHRPCRSERSEIRWPSSVAILLRAQVSREVQIGFL